MIVDGSQYQEISLLDGMEKASRLIMLLLVFTSFYSGDGSWLQVSMKFPMPKGEQFYL